MTRAGGKGAIACAPARASAAIFHVLSQGQQRGSEKEIVASRRKYYFIVGADVYIHAVCRAQRDLLNQLNAAAPSSIK